MSLSVRCVLLAVAVLVLSANVFAGQLSAFTASYDIFDGSTKVGVSNKSFSYPDDGAYLYTSVEQIKVSLYHQNLSEKSEGELTRDGYQPKQYSVLTNSKPSFQKQDFAVGLQDNLSQSLMLSYFLLNNETPQTIELITAQGPQTYAFEVIQTNSQLDTALGKLDVTQVRFQDDKGNQVDEWLAKQYEYLPVQYQISKNGKTSGMIYLTSASNQVVSP